MSRPVATTQNVTVHVEPLDCRYRTSIGAGGQQRQHGGCLNTVYEFASRVSRLAAERRGLPKGETRIAIAAGLRLELARRPGGAETSAARDVSLTVSPVPGGGIRLALAGNPSPAAALVCADSRIQSLAMGAGQLIRAQNPPLPPARILIFHFPEATELSL